MLVFPAGLTRPWHPTIVILMNTLLLLTIAAQSPTMHDLVIYGGTSAAVTAAMQAHDQGLDVVVLSPDKHLGGLTSGGLGWTDSGKKEAIGGLSRQFYRDIKTHYDAPASWRQQTRGEYLAHPRFGKRPPVTEDAFWVFEPSVAEAIFDRYIADRGLTVLRGRLQRDGTGVDIDGGRITAIRTEDGRTLRARVFIDATYEGDLMAAAGVSYHVGREANATYGESLNGMQPLRQTGENSWAGTLKHQFFNYDKTGGESKLVKISPFVAAGDPASGLLPYIQPQGPKAADAGQGDHRIQAYNFRMCLTSDPSNRVPFAKPATYDAMNYELLARYLETGWRGVWNKFDPAPNAKTDTNNHGPFSTDFIGENYDYPEASYARREEIIREHRDYQEGLMWFLANDPRVPADVRKTQSQWGKAKDEFADNDHWPHQIYVREARRMIGAIVMSEALITGRQPVPQPIGMGSYNMDSHNTQRYAVGSGRDAYVLNEGDVQVNPGGPYPISYQAITPKAAECTNLLVPAACSASHIAYGSIRMEPVFMILGQSAASAAAIAIADDVDVQAVDYDRLRKRLLADGQVLDLPNSTANRRMLSVSDFEGVVQDAGSMSTGWKPSTATRPHIGTGYYATNTPRATATFELAPQQPGDYTVRLAGPPNANRSAAVSVRASTATQQVDATLDQRTGDLFKTVGTLSGLTAGETVRVQVTAGETGYTVVDAVQLVPVEDE